MPHPSLQDGYSTLCVNLGVQQVRLRKAHSSARREEGEDPTKSHINLEVVEDRRSDHRIERSLHVALLELLLKEAHPIRRKPSSSGPSQQIGRDVDRHDRRPRAGEYLGEHPCAATDLERTGPDPEPCSSAYELRPARGPLSPRRSRPSPRAFRVTFREYAAVGDFVLCPFSHAWFHSLPLHELDLADCE
jgi:hypothetical protein